MNDRSKLIELITSQQVTNAEFYNSLRQQTPLLSKLMMDQFKTFLNDDYFTDIERQTMLMKFFEEQTNEEVIQEVLNHIQKCDCKDDYTTVIMEWTFNNSDNIIKNNLSKVDGAALYGKRKKVNRLAKPPALTEEVLNNLIALTADLIGIEDDDEDDDGGENNV